MDGAVANHTLVNELHRALFSLWTRAATEDEPGPPPLEFYITQISASAYTKQTIVAFLTWVVYEMIITTGESVKLFWKQKWNLPKTLFFIATYPENLALSIIKQFCSVMPRLGLVGSFIVVFVISLTMLLRVTALWNRSRLIKMITICLFLVNIFFFVASALYAHVKGDDWIPLEIPPFTGCLPRPDTRIPLYAIFTVALVFETSIVLFTILKSYPFLAQKSNSMDGGMFRLSSVLLNDGVAYYVAVILSHVISMYASIAPVDANPMVTIPIMASSLPIPVSIVACNRLFLRLHDVLLTREDNYELTQPGGERRAGAATVSTEVSAFALTDMSSMGNSGGSGEGDVRLQPPVKTNGVQIRGQLETVDYDYHDHLRKI
ncbi:hypothetical protein FRC15_005924 [Serendipita sp. 397]|nr:hypothetical protein FRC15_005924 [Serendipita sp. 397]